jgi:hypothetical protein
MEYSIHAFCVTKKRCENKKGMIYLFIRGGKKGSGRIYDSVMCQNSQLSFDEALPTLYESFLITYGYTHPVYNQTGFDISAELARKCSELKHSLGKR